MKTIRCGQRLTVIVDDDDYEWLSSMKWYRSPEGYAVRTRRINGKQLTFRMHRLIIKAPPEFHVDHIDGNIANNQKSNLRLCTRGQNMCNIRRLKADNTSGARGVFLNKANGTWYSVIEHNKKQHRVGSGFKTVREAAKAYDEMAKKLHGEFATLNSRIGVI